MPIETRMTLSRNLEQQIMNECQRIGLPPGTFDGKYTSAIWREARDTIDKENFDDIVNPHIQQKVRAIHMILTKVLRRKDVAPFIHSLVDGRYDVDHLKYIVRATSLSITRH